MIPAWILDAVAVVMLAVAAVSAVRLVVARPWWPDSVFIDADVAHLLMAIAMAGMLAPSLRTFPIAVWEVIFEALIALFAFRVAQDARSNGVRALAGGHCAPHLVHSGSMLYISLAMSASAAGMSGPQMLRHPTLTFAFALILIGYTIWDLDQLSGKRYSLTSARVSLAGIGAAGVPAMVGVERVTSELAGRADGRAVHPRDAGADLRAVRAARANGAVGAVLLSPAVTVGCRVATGVAMAFMLLIAI